MGQRFDRSVTTETAGGNRGREALDRFDGGGGLHAVVVNVFRHEINFTQRSANEIALAALSDKDLISGYIFISPRPRPWRRHGKQILSAEASS
jgi:hypothetical protein